MRGLALLIGIMVLASASHAQVIQTRVRLKGLDRDLYARVNEPGRWPDAGRNGDDPD